MTQRERTTRRWLAPVMAALLLAVVAACGTEAVGERATSELRSTEAAAPTAGLIVAAGTRSAEASSLRMRATITRGPDTVSSLTSNSNADGSRIALVSDLGDLGTIEARGIDGTFYLSVPLLEGRATWLSIDTTAFRTMAAPMLDGLVEQDPRSVFDALSEVSSTVTEVGRDEVEGVATTRYRMTIDAARVAAAFVPGGMDGVEGSAELEVWIDDEGYVRRLRSELDGPGGTGDPLVVEVTVSSYDEPVDVVAPPPEETVTLEQFLAQGGLGALGRTITGD